MKRMFMLSMTIALFSSGVFSQIEAGAAPVKKPKNFIMMVMDGTNSDAVTLARWYKGRKLALDEILSGGVRTYSYRSAITDSAAAGTALATGRKTIVDAIGMAPKDVSGQLAPGTNGGRFSPRQELLEKNVTDGLVPAASILEAAKKAGKAAGIVSTSPVQHATPAAFSAHVENRANYEDIAEQQVYQGIDVVLGGGMTFLLPENRRDKADLVKTIFQSGYAYSDNKDMMNQATPGKLWGSFAPWAIANELDRKQFFPQQPSLADMTKKALGSLSRDKDGFFLFVEGSKVDWAAHQNDPAGMVSEILSFDAAVKEALDFAKKDGNTLVVAVTDHGNSGLTIGNGKTDKTYAVSSPSTFIKPLKKAKVTLEGAMWLLKKDRSNLREAAEKYGLAPLSKDEWRRLRRAEGDAGLEREMARMLAKRANLGFTTHGHTGEDVFLYSYGPGRPSGLINNIDIPRLVSGYWGVDLDALSRDKYKDAEAMYLAAGYKVGIDESNEANPVLTAQKGRVILTYPANKNYHYQNGRLTKQTSPTIYNRGRFYVQ
ncbi:alkaline phosphatase [Peribacillus sp. SCS-37]